MTKAQLSVAIITFNEEDNIGRCLDSVLDLADDIVVVDSLSSDRTPEIVQGYAGVRFISQPFLGYDAQKNFCVDQAKYDIVLSLDADEALSDELRTSIKAVMANFTADAYTMNRLTSYCGKWVRHSGWYPDTKLRLWYRAKGRFVGNPHDAVQMETGSKIVHLKSDILHYSYTSIAQHVGHINSFTTIAAEEAFAKGRKVNVFADIVINPFLTFLKKYFLKLGFLDGYAGFLIAIHSAYGKFVKYIKLKELYDKQKTCK